MNEHATKVLDAYLDAERLPVPHAVLIDGKWGSGKTYFLQYVYEPGRKQVSGERRPAHVPFLFISVFGAKSAAEVELRIYKTACPGEAVAGTIAGTIALGIGEFFRVKEAAKTALDKFGETAIRRLNDFVFVFDDLERVEKAAFGEIMGLINSFVAEHDRRVVLVTDEKKLEELVGGDTWKDQNEKIVGRRAIIEPNVRSVVETAVAGLPEGAAKAFLGERVDDLVEVARTSKVENLRNLSWGMHNVAEFAECLLSDSDIPAQHVSQTVGVVLATTLWMRSGLLNEKALARLGGLSMTLAFRNLGNGNVERPAEPDLEMAKAFTETFVDLQIENPPVDYEFVVGFERSGIIDCDEILKSIKSRFGFGEGYEEPAWRKLWYAYDRPVADTEKALRDLAVQLERRELTKHGEILHAVGLAIKFAKANDERLTGGKGVVEFFEGYVDDLAQKGTIERRKRDFLPLEYESYGSLGFTAKDTPEFKAVYDHLGARLGEVEAIDLRERVEASVLKAEDGDLEALFDFVHHDDQDLSRKPVLQGVDANRLATLFTKDPVMLSAGGKLLAYRYSKTTPGDPLLTEIPWARQVYQAVLSKLAAWQDPHRTLAINSFQGVIRHYEQARQPDERIVPAPASEESEQEDGCLTKGD